MTTVNLLPVKLLTVVILTLYGFNLRGVSDETPIEDGQLSDGQAPDGQAADGHVHVPPWFDTRRMSQAKPTFSMLKLLAFLFSSVTVLTHQGFICVGFLRPNAY